VAEPPRAAAELCLAQVGAPQGRDDGAEHS